MTDRLFGSSRMHQSDFSSCRPKSAPRVATRCAAALGLIPIVASASACAGPDHLTEPVVSEGGSYFLQFESPTASGGTGNNSGPSGGTSSSNSSGLGGVNNGFGGNSSSVATGTFDWGANKYDPNGGANVAYQGHFTGMACISSSCHSHGFAFGGSVYSPGGTATASNAQIGIWMNGNFTTVYAGKQGNFFASLSGNVDWSKAIIAVRTANGTSAMAVNGQANGNCNSCHDSSRRIIAP
jgi:hypothetical protein